MLQNTNIYKKCLYIIYKLRPFNFSRFFLPKKKTYLWYFKCHGKRTHLVLHIVRHSPESAKFGIYVKINKQNAINRIVENLIFFSFKGNVSMTGIQIDR